MSFSFSSLIRLLSLLALGSTMVAVGLSKLDPPKPGWRVRRITKDFNLNEYYLDVIDRTPRWLDAETGRLARIPVVDGDVLETASTSPWVDEQGRRQVIGRWSSRTKGGPMAMSQDFGLARYTFPAGEVLDHVSTEIVPVSPPCWFPGTRARVIFPAGDGMLYQYTFEPEGSEDAEGGRDARPTPLTWRCPMPGGGKVFLGDLSWPEDPRMAGRLIVSLRHQGPEAGRSRVFSRLQLWWIKLNHAGTEVVEAGRLVTPDVGGEGRSFDERLPIVSALPDGRAVLGYLHQETGETGWQLRIAPISFDLDRGTPSVLESSARTLAGNCQASYPSFSPDGRWLNVVVGQAPHESRVARLRTARALPDLASTPAPPLPAPGS